MGRQILTAMLGVALLGLPAFNGGCDRTVEKHETEKQNSDGTKTTDQKTVTKDADGGTTVKEKHETK